MRVGVDGAVRAEERIRLEAEGGIGGNYMHIGMNSELIAGHETDKPSP